MSDVPAPVAIPPERTNEVQFGPWLSESFQRFVDCWGVWVGQGLIATVISTAPLAVGMALFFPTYFDAIMQLESVPRDQQQELLVQMLSAYGYVLAGAVAQSFLMFYLLAGMTSTAARQLRGESISVAAVFTGGGRPFTALAHAFLITAVIFCCGVPTCYLAFLPLAAFWFFALPLITEERRGLFDALATSWRAVSDQWLYYVLWVLLMGALMLVGQSLCYVGTVITHPVLAIALAIAYRDVFGMEGAKPRPKQAPPPLPSGME